MGAPAASAVPPAITWWDRRRWIAHQQLCGVRKCLTVKVRVHYKCNPTPFLILIRAFFFCAFVTNTPIYVFLTYFALLAVTCQNPEGDIHLISKCSKPSTELQPGSTCSFSCEAGFELQGAPSVQCSEDGQWSKDIPTCKGTEGYFHINLYIQHYLALALSQPICTLILCLTSLLSFFCRNRMSCSHDSNKWPDQLQPFSVFTCFYHNPPPFWYDLHL